jgi:hypothetical protein
MVAPEFFSHTQRADLTRRNIMDRRTTLALTTVALLCLGGFGSARADEKVEFREVMHATSVQPQEVGDVEGHVPALVRFSGLALFPDGAVGTTYFVGATDYTKGTGPYSAYHNVTFADGSVLWLKWVGTTTSEGTISRVKGTVSVIGGKGRFEGAKGDGTVNGTRLTPLAAGADLYLDLVINVKK